jgi:hypothetical protein
MLVSNIRCFLLNAQYSVGKTTDTGKVKSLTTEDTEGKSRNHRENLTIGTFEA